MNGDLDPRLVEEHYPFQSLIGFAMTAWQRDYARFDLPITDKLSNRYGIVHGGVYAVLLDTVMGYAGCYTGSAENRQLVMTLSLTTNFVGQPTGNVLIGEAHKVGGGRRTFYANASIKDDRGSLVTTGSGVFRYRGA